jgi:hypothetical protein
MYTSGASVCSYFFKTAKGSAGHALKTPALEYSIRRVQVNKDGTHQLLVYANDDDNILGERVHTI